ncbi:MAG: Na+/H+ antiporter subunit E [Micrococcaceae bacterium]
MTWLTLSTWLTWPFRLFVFSLWYAKALIDSNWAVLKDNLTPGHDARSGIARVPTRCITDTEVTVLSALITLTPGTLTMGTKVEDDGTRVLYVHALYNDDADEVRADTADMEGRMLHAMRRKGDRT